MGTLVMVIPGDRGAGAPGIAAMPGRSAWTS